jgi:hypothetical protein
MDATAALAERECALASRSYEEGQIGLAEFAARATRGTVEARLVHLERQLEAVEMEIELQARAGVLR